MSNSPENQPQNASEIVSQPSNSLQSVSPEEQNPTVLESTRLQATTVAMHNWLGSLPLSRWLVLGGIALAMFFTFFLMTKGSDFCMFSTCIRDGGTTATVGHTMATNFWAYAGGAATLIVLTTMGSPIIPAVAASAFLWFLIQMSLS